MRPFQASQEQLACALVPGESHPNSKVSAQPPSLVVEERPCSPGPAIAPTSACSSNLYRRIKQRLDFHLEDYTTKGVWSVPESTLHINFQALKAVLLAPIKLKHLCRDQIVLIALDNTTVVSYINKEGGMRSGSLCAYLWRLLCWCNLSELSCKFITFQVF